MEVVGHVVQCLLDVVGRDAARKSTEIPFEMLDVGFDLNGGVRNDGVFVQPAGT